MSNIIIETKSLTKQYKNTIALNNVDLTINKGTIVGLLGKNGAGKSTLNKLITGVIFPTSGFIKVFGKIPKGGERKIGFLSENIAIYPNLSARENLEVIFLQEGNSPNKDKISKILKMVSINDTKKKAKDFSLGMKRRLQIAMTVLTNDKELYILDEPTNGLDIDGVFWLKDLLIDLKKQGKTILLSSHSILELEDVLTDYLILKNGGISDKGKLIDLKEEILNVELLSTDVNRAISLLTMNNFKFEKNHNTLYLPLEETDYTTYIKILYDAGIIPTSYYIKKNSLVDRFRKFAGGEKTNEENSE